jgi:UPF0755 protein
MIATKNILFFGFLAGVLIGAFGGVLFITRTVPDEFPIGKHFTVLEHESLRSVSLRLKEEHYIYSSLLFRAWISSRGRDRNIQAGEYSFNEPSVLGTVVKKFANGSPDLPLLSITIPEGVTTMEIAEIAHKVLPSIDKESFVSKVQEENLDGKLFPSTYFLLPSHTDDDVIKLMSETFDVTYNKVRKGAELPSPLTSDTQVVSLAAILEGEAKTKEDMGMVAGILLTRLSQGMPLQVDVAKETYIKKGLPEIPINNPGEVALFSVFHSNKSSYLYYITGKDGTMHYASTFKEHRQNILRYLK